MIKITPVLKNSLVGKPEILEADYDFTLRDVSQKIRGADLLKFAVVTNLNKPVCGFSTKKTD